MSNQEWMPGSPLTPGAYWAITGSNIWNPFIPGFNRFVVEWFDFSTPLRAQMQGGGSIPRASSASQSDNTRFALYRLMTEDVFHCPSNGQVASPYGGAGPDGIKATSYLTMNTIIRGGPDVYNKTGKFSQYQALNLSQGNSTLGQSAGWDVRVPDSYLPRHNKLGRENIKVFVAEGLRFYGGPAANPPFTYNTNRAERDGKGIMSATPPSTATATNNREYILAKQYSWRHGDNNRINAGFFDGHVEGLAADTNTDPMKGNAIHPKYYYPSGSIVAIPSGLQANTIPVGTELP